MTLIRKKNLIILRVKFFKLLLIYKNTEHKEFYIFKRKFFLSLKTRYYYKI